MKGKIMGVAFTARQRKQKALQNAITSWGVDAEDLVYTEDLESRTGKVTHKTGQILMRTSW